MSFEEIVDQAIEMLRRRGQVTYRMLKVQFGLDDNLLEVLKEELIYSQRLAVDEDERVLVWIDDTESAPSPSVPTPTASPVKDQRRTMSSLYKVVCERFDRWFDEEGKVCKHDSPVHDCPHCPTWRSWVEFFMRGLALIALLAIVITVGMTILGWGFTITFQWFPHPLRPLVGLAVTLLSLYFVGGNLRNLIRDYAGWYGCMLCGAILVYVVYPESFQIADRLGDDIVDALGFFFGLLMVCIAWFGIGSILMLIGFVATSPFMGFYYWIAGIRRRRHAGRM